MIMQDQDQNKNKHIIRDSQTGELIIKGTAITVAMVIDELWEGADIGEVRKRFGLTREQTRAIFDYILTVREKAFVYLIR